MPRKLLITVSDDVSYLHGVRFVGSFFRNKSAIGVTLFYVAPHADLAGKATTAVMPAELDRKAAEAGQSKAREALDAARVMLCDRGFPSGNVESKFIFREFGTVKDIMREAGKGAYDAVVLGRRGYMLFESVLATSITRDILDRRIDFPLWICRHPEEGRRNVLLCVDGSEAGLRMVNHVGCMLRNETEHSITLFHVDTGEGESKEALLGQAGKTLIDNGIPASRIETVVSAAPITGVAKTILDTADRGAFAVIGVGRVGVEKGRLKEWLVGSRTMKLVETVQKAALWVS